MRGDDDICGSLFSYIDLEDRVRADHPLRPIREIANAALAQGRAIYCTLSFAIRRALTNAIVGSLRRDFPAAVIVDALTIYRDHNDWSRRWYSEHERYCAGVVVTRAESLPEGTDPFAWVPGEHFVGCRVSIEIQALVRHGRPVAWRAVSGFAIQPFNCISTSHYAGLSAAQAAEPFHHVIGPSFFRVVWA